MSSATRPVNTIPRIEINDYLVHFLREVSLGERQNVEIKTLWQAQRIKGLMDIAKNTQKFDFVPSNLGNGKGFIFYFLCNGCGRRARYLYFRNTISEPLCRICCRLSYKRPSRKTRALSRILHKPYLSSEDKYIIMERAGVTKEDLRSFLNSSISE